MTDFDLHSHDLQRELTRSISGHSVHVRRIVKPDGREVVLYGYHRNTCTIADKMLEGGPKTAQLRWHPLRREWSVYAAGRQGRTFKPSLADDPLAPTKTDGAVTEIPVDDFEFAIFENRFPSFSVDPGTLGDPAGVDVAPASGHCEVVVYTSAPTGSLATLTKAARELLVSAWIDRYAEHFKRGANYVLPFENRGDAVGVTLPHPHGQIYAMPVIPKVQSDMLTAFEEGYRLDRAIGGWSDYIIAESENMIAFAPPFARFPYEIWIMSSQRRAHLADHEDHELCGFAHLLGDITRRYDVFFGQATPYMLSLQAAPRGGESKWHFTAQFYPLLRTPDKLKYLASVEQSSGLFTVDVLPEDAANILRDV